MLTHYLEKHFARFDHAQLAARVILNGIRALLEVTHFCIQHSIAQLSLLVDLLLLVNQATYVPYLEPTALA